MKRSERAPVLNRDFFTPFTYEVGLRGVLDAYFNDVGAERKRQPRRLVDVRKSFHRFVSFLKAAPDISAPNPNISQSRLEGIYFVAVVVLLAILSRLYLLSSVTNGDVTTPGKLKSKRLYLPKNPSQECACVEPEAVPDVPLIANPAYVEAPKPAAKFPIGLANALNSADVNFIKGFVATSSSLINCDKHHLLDEILMLCEGYQFHSLKNAGAASFADDFEEDVIHSVLDYIDEFLPLDSDYRNFGSKSAVVEAAIMESTKPRAASTNTTTAPTPKPTPTRKHGLGSVNATERRGHQREELTAKRPVESVGKKRVVRSAAQCASPPLTSKKRPKRSTARKKVQYDVSSLQQGLDLDDDDDDDDDEGKDSDSSWSCSGAEVSENEADNVTI